MMIAMVCGEASGDQLGAGLARELRVRMPDIDLVGVTGPAMLAAGVKSWLDYDKFAVIGYTEVLRNIVPLLRARHAVQAMLAQTKPVAMIGLDAPDLNMGLGRQVHASGGKYVQYVCPSFWAWRAQRAAFLAAHCDRVLALLPFEQEHCRQAGIKADFVGHRLADELRPDPGARARARQELGIAAEAKVLALLPGSRKQELAVHIPLFVATAQECRRQMPGLEAWLAPLTPIAETALDGVTGQCAGQAQTLLAAADIALVKSGTVTLEATLLDCPQVIAYKLGKVRQLFMHWRLGDISTQMFGLPNLVAGDKFVPELLEDEANVANLTAAVLGLLDADRAAAMRAGYARVRTSLAHQADERAAQAVLEVVGA